ncbi:hypothetical protein A4X13_0g7479, partial [Tilletia indica]
NGVDTRSSADSSRYDNGPGSLNLNDDDDEERKA